MASASGSQIPMASGSNGGGANNIITALGAAFKSQTGDPLPGEKIAQLLLQNMNQLGELAKQGKLNHQQIMQVCPLFPLLWLFVNSHFVFVCQLKEYADKHKAPQQVRFRTFQRPILVERRVVFAKT